MSWNKAKLLAVAALIALLLAGSATWFSFYKAPRMAAPKLVTFEPMAGEWEGAFTLSDDPSVPDQLRSAMLIVTTADHGQRCEIEMRVQGAPGNREQVYHFSHEIRDGGHRLYSKHDRQIARTDGEGEVIDSLQKPGTGEWRAAFRQSFQNNRGQMEGSWHRHGDYLDISSHDEYRGPRRTNHVFSELKLQRRAAPRTAQAQ